MNDYFPSQQDELVLKTKIFCYVHVTKNIAQNYDQRLRSNDVSKQINKSLIKGFLLSSLRHCQEDEDGRKETVGGDTRGQVSWLGGRWKDVRVHWPNTKREPPRRNVPPTLYTSSLLTHEMN